MPEQSSRPLLTALISVLVLATVVAAWLYLHDYRNLKSLDGALLKMAAEMALIVAVIGAVVALRRSMSRPQAAVLALGTFGAAMGAAAMWLGVLNAVFDPGPTTVHPAVVTSAYPDFVSVGSWRDESSSETLFPSSRFPHAIFDYVHPGDRLLVTTAPGRLGLEWVVAVRRDAPTADGRSPGPGR